MAAPAALFSKDSDVVVLEVFKSVASLSVSINYPKLGILSRFVILKFFSQYSLSLLLSVSLLFAQFDFLQLYMFQLLSYYLQLKNVILSKDTHIVLHFCS
jgi:hypothetical protein